MVTVRILALATLVLISPLGAQDVSVRGFLDREEVGPGQIFTLSVEISGTSQVSGEPRLPDVSAFASYLGSGSTQRINFVNGRTSVTTTLQFRYQTSQEGTFRIPPVALTIAGREYRTEPLDLIVRQGAAAPRGGPAAEEEATIADDDLFIRTIVSQPQVYQNEAVVVEYRLYTRVRVSNFSVTAVPGSQGFWVEEFPQPPTPVVGTEVYNGREYTVATLRRVALFPTSTGTKTIQPMGIEAGVRVQRRSRDPFEGFFGSSLLGSTIAKNLQSQPVDIRVVPLPDVGRPEDFTGHVGTLSVSATIDRAEAETNEAITYRLTIAGAGNIQSLPNPQVDFPAGFEVYDPEVKTTMERSDDRISGRRTIEYVLVPRLPGVDTIPQVDISYFDPFRNRYAVASARALPISISGDPVVGGSVAGSNRRAITNLREDIRFIRTEPGQLRRTSGSVGQSMWFWLIAIAPMTAIGGAVVYRRQRDRVLGDVAYARDRRAGRLARKRLSHARAVAHPDQAKQLYDETARALLGFVGDKLNIAQAGVVKDQLLAQLAQRNVEPAIAEQFVACLEECDRYQYAPTVPTQEQIDSFLERVERAMTALEKGLRK